MGCSKLRTNDSDDWKDFATSDVLIHELKQPLFAAQLLANRLLRRCDSDEFGMQEAFFTGFQKEVEGILYNLTLLGKIIDTYENIIRADFVSVGWDSEIIKLFDSLKLRADKFGIEICIDCLIRGQQFGPDPRIVSQIVSNIFINSIEAIEKFAPEKRKIKVEGAIRCKSSECSLKDFVVSISNSAEPIEDSEVQSLFKRGYSSKGVKRGVGLGLWLCKKMVREFGGTVQVDKCNVLGGARFTVILPLQ